MPMINSISRRRLPRRLVQLFLGLALYGVSIAALVLADLGLMPWDVLHQGLARLVDLSLGTVIIVVGVIVLLAWIPLRERPGVGTVANVVVVGLVADAVLAAVDPPSSLPVRLALAAGGILLNAVATAAYVGVRLGAGPRDGLMTGLVRRTGREVVSRPMAGTTPRRDDPHADDDAVAALIDSNKDDREHRLVVDAVLSALAPSVSSIEVGDPVAERFTSVTHLTTTIIGALHAQSSANAWELAQALHPTPAVGGSPRDAALATIARLESFSRGNYGGPVGWVDANGDGEFAVALRCAEIDGVRARLLAGAGIVDGSDPDLEWAETQAKLEPMLRCLVRP